MPLKFTYSIAFFIFALIGIMAFDNYSGRKTKNTIYRAIMITIPIYFIISLLPRFLFFMIGDMADLGDDGIFIIIPLMTLGTVFFLFLKGLFFPGEGLKRPYK